MVTPLNNTLCKYTYYLHNAKYTERRNEHRMSFPADFFNKKPTCLDTAICCIFQHGHKLLILWIKNKYIYKWKNPLKKDNV